MITSQRAQAFRRRPVRAVAAVTVVLLAAIAPDTATARSALDMRRAVALRDALNRVRAGRRLHALVLEAHLMRAAQNHATELGRRGTLDHRGLDGEEMDGRARRLGYVFVAIGETLSSGSGDPRQVIRRWLQSPPHRRTITSRDYVHMGVGFARHGRTPIWVLVVAAPSRRMEGRTRPIR